MRVGYVRVSTVDQHTERQLADVDVEKVFTGKASGKDAKRPQLHAALDFVREGDTLVAHSMDRLARNLGDLRSIVDQVTAKGAEVAFVKENLTFDGSEDSMSRLMLNVMGAFAEFERSLARERQREGIAQAKARGVYKGRAPALDAEQVEALRGRAAAGKSKSALAREFGIARATVYTYLKPRLVEAASDGR